MSVTLKPVAVPVLDLRAQYQTIRDEIEPVVRRALREPDVRDGPRGRRARGRARRTYAASRAESAAPRGPTPCFFP